VRLVAQVRSVALGVAVDRPLNTLSDSYSFSAHMVQFLLITIISGPLLVADLPA